MLQLTAVWQITLDRVFICAKYCAEVANKKDETQNEKVGICGITRESGDVLIEEIELPSLNEA